MDSSYQCYVGGVSTLAKRTTIWLMKNVSNFGLTLPAHSAECSALVSFLLIEWRLTIIGHKYYNKYFKVIDV